MWFPTYTKFADFCFFQTLPEDVLYMNSWSWQQCPAKIIYWTHTKWQRLDYNYTLNFVIAKWQNVVLGWETGTTCAAVGRQHKAEITPNLLSLYYTLANSQLNMHCGDQMCHNQTGSQCVQNLLTLILDIEDLLCFYLENNVQPKSFTKLVKTHKGTHSQLTENSLTLFIFRHWLKM